jgi:hypothetical protein
LHWTGPAERSSWFESWLAPGRQVNVSPLSAAGTRLSRRARQLPATWDHPKLGRFEYRGGWAKKFNFPAFKAFSYDSGYDNARRSTGKHGMLFWASSESDLPSPEAAGLASKVVANQAELVAQVADALWDDFSGRGPDYGNWWHGCLEKVAKSIGPKRVLRGPEDTTRLLKVDAVFIRSAYSGMPGYDKPAVEIAFRAAFEPEHGVGVLTDGVSILGIGYTLDVVLFEPPKRSRKRSSR